MPGLLCQAKQDEKNGFGQRKRFHIAFNDMSYDAILLAKVVRVKRKLRFRVKPQCAGAGWGWVCWFPKSTFGTARDPSLAAKYALFTLNPMPEANMLAGNCCT